MHDNLDMRCTYCREIKASDAYTSVGDHVVPTSLGGAWVDYRVCGDCNVRANEVADELVSKDFVVRFLRALYEVPDRYGKRPSPPVYSLRLPGGGVVKAILGLEGPTFEAGLSVSVADRLALDDPNDQPRLREIFVGALGGHEQAADPGSLGLARLAQERATPPQAWSRFMAKVGLACGREAYGDAWLDSRQAQTLSHDLLTDALLRFSQRTHYPPVERAWPYEPPKHQLWIEPHEDTAVLTVALFGQVLAAVPVNDLPARAHPSAWALDPLSRTFYRSTYPAIWVANAARRVEDAGGTPYIIGDQEHPFVYTPDGRDGPINLGVATHRVESPGDAFEIARRRSAQEPR